MMPLPQHVHSKYVVSTRGIAEMMPLPQHGQQWPGSVDHGRSPRPPAAPEAHPLAQGGPVGLSGEAEPRAYRSEAAAARCCLPHLADVTALDHTGCLRHSTSSQQRRRQRRRRSQRRSQRRRRSWRWGARGGSQRW